MMLNYQVTSLSERLKEKIKHSENKRLIHSKVVTKVYHCEAYIFYLSNESKFSLTHYFLFFQIKTTTASGLVNIKLGLQPSIPAAPGTTADSVSHSRGVRIAGGEDGVFNYSVSEKGQREYTLLYDLETVCGPRGGK